MVMVVVHSVFVASGGTDWLNAPKKSVVHQHAEGVVHGLARDGTDVGLCNFGHFVRCHVRPTRDRTKNGDALGRRLNAAFAKLVDGTEAHWNEP
jgi:hypothetical protein